MSSCYLRYTNDPTKMNKELCSAEAFLTRLSDELVYAETKIQSMVPVIHCLSSTLDSIAELNEYIAREYHPVLSGQMALIARIDAQRKLIQDMNEAMQKPQYIADREVYAAQHLENARIEAQTRFETKLVEDANESLDEDEIRGMIRRGLFYPADLTERATTFKVGDFAGVKIYDGGRSMAIDWVVPCVVLKRVTTMEHKDAYVVCLFDQYEDSIGCRFVEDANLYGPPLSGLI